MQRHRVKTLVLIIALALLLCHVAGLGCSAPGPTGKIAYIANGENSRELYLMDADGSNKVKLASNANSACISPDGTKVIYFKYDHEVGLGEVDDTGVYMIGTDGEGDTKIATISARQFAWSPDGTKIAYVDSNHIYIMNADGSDGTRVSPAGASWSHCPSWSPDDTKIAFSTMGNNHQDLNIAAGLYTVNTDGSDFQLLVGAEHSHQAGVAWSPDGEKIAYIDEYSKICLINADGSGKETILTCEDIADTTDMLLFLVWSPNGKELVFSANYEVQDQIFKGWYICTINADGSNLTIVADDANQSSFPSWDR